MTPQILALLEAAAKGAILLTLGLLAMPLMRRTSAAARHLVLALAMLSAAAVVPLALLLPAWRVPLLAPIDGRADAPVPTATTVTATSARPRPAPNGTTPSAATVTQSGEAPTSRVAIAAPRPSPRLVPRITPSLLAPLWLLGALAVLLHHALGAVLVARLRRRALRLSDAGLSRLRDELTRRLGIRRHVELFASASADMPLTWGTWRPAVLLPTGAAKWDEAQSRAVLHHELAHVARRDCAWQLVATVATALHWYNPTVWLAARRLRAERERACDDLVLAGGADPLDYAERLLDAARTYRAPMGMAAAAIAMARPSQLRGRVAAILDHATSRDVPSRRARRLAIGAMAAMLLPTAAMSPWRALETVSAADASLASVPPALDPVAVLGALPSHTDTLTWSRRMERGQELRVYTMKSAIQVERSPDRDVHLITIFGADDGRGPRQHEFDEDQRSIEVCPALPAGVPRIPRSGCWPVDWERERRRDNTVRTIAQVPDGILVRARTYDGAIVATGMTSPLAAETVDGDVRVESAGPVSANAVGGNIDVTLTRTARSEPQSLKTVSGRIVLRLPRDADVEVTMKHSGAPARTNVGVEREWLGAQGRTHTLVRAGTGAARMNVESWTGEITVVRDDGAPLVSTGGAISMDDSEPGRDPDPNPDALGDSPSESPSPSPSISTSLRAYRVSEGGITGERVALELPADFLRRRTADAFRGGLDSAQRMMLVRIAAPRWNAYQGGRDDPGVELAGDRALWALSVSDGVDLTGALLEQLNSPSWRTRAYAAWTLGVTNAARSADPLLHATGDMHWRVRAAAASALALVRPASAAAPLEALLDDPQYQVRAAAVIGLGTIGDRGALPKLRVRLTDEHAMVRAAAEYAVAQLDTRGR